jgi:lipoyl(octanoyl) transferase
VTTQIEIFRHAMPRSFSYADLERRQAEITDAVLRGEPGRLIFAEVAPVVTLGFRKTEEDLLIGRAEFARRGIEISEVTRGGRATYHGPGQWVIFPVDSLERLTGDRRGVRKVVELLLDAVIDATRVRYPRAQAREGKEAGAWSEPGPRGAKFAALGIRIIDGVVQHGVSVNVFPTPESFAGIRPCGLESPVAFLAAEAADHEAAFLAWRVRLEQSLLARFPGFSPRE